MLTGYMLHPAVGEQSQRPPQGQGTIVPIPWGYIMAEPVLEIWIGLGP